MISCKIKRKAQFETHRDSDLIKEIFTVILLVMSYIVNIPILTLAAFIIACGFVIFSKYQKSVYYLAFFTSFSGIFVFKGRHMFFLMAGLFILKSLVVNKINKNTLIFYLVIIAYCIVFSDIQGEYSFARIIGLILLFLIPLIASYSDKIDCSVFIQHYIFGFVIATIIGFFVKSIPSMYKLFDTDIMWTKNYQELTRFFGLAFDSNFYALSNYTIIAYLLFAFEKINPFRGILILFLLISGVMTISKSYLLIIGVLLALYIVKNISKIKYIMIFLLAAIIGIWIFSIISKKIGFNAIDLIIARFVKGGDIADNTTGRVDIWKDYIEIFKASGIKKLLFGFGFNTEVIHAAHNTFIEFFYHFGFIGTVLWGVYFIYCGNLFRKKTIFFENKTPLVCICLITGIFFLSAYTYEAFWIGIVISMMTLGKRIRANENIIQHNSADL